MASYLSRTGTVCTRGIGCVGGEGKCEGRWLRLRLRLRWFGVSCPAMYSSIPSPVLFTADVDAGLVVSTDFSIEAARFVLLGLASSSVSLDARGRFRVPSLLEDVDGISQVAIGRGNRLARLRTSANLNLACSRAISGVAMSFITLNTHKLSTEQEALCPRIMSVTPTTPTGEPQTGAN
jgi:hypothetical protein